MKNKIIIAGLGITVILGWIVTGQLGCEWIPDRDNPLDPNSNLFNPVLTGEVTNLANVPVFQAMVTLHPEVTVAVTGNDGVYRFEGVDLGEYTLTVQKAGHVGDTVNVNIASGGTTTQNFQINALPQFDSISVTSHNIEQPLQNNVYINITAKITDLDRSTSGDSILALFEEDTLDYLFYVQTIGISDIFARNFPSSAFDTTVIESTIGRPFHLIAIDFHGGVNNSESQYVIRFLETPIIVGPDGFAEVIQTPTLDWFSYEGQFEFHQNVRVFDDIGNLVWDSLAIPPDVSQITVTDTLQLTAPGGPVYYYWTLEIVDIFSNTAKSDDLTFTVIAQ